MNKNRRKKDVSIGKRNFSALFARSKIFARTQGDGDWYIDTPDVRLTRVFTIVLLMHVVAVGGVIAFKMIEKAGDAGDIASNVEYVHDDVTVVESRVGSEQLEPRFGRASKPSEEKVLNGRYQVKADDTIVEIAREVGVSVSELRRKNSINNENELYPGRWIIIQDQANAQFVDNNSENSEIGPDAGTVSPEPKAVEREVKTEGRIHVVTKGDTAYAISQKFGIAYSDLLSLNGIDDPEKMQIGQKLLIPNQ